MVMLPESRPDIDAPAASVALPAAVVDRRLLEHQLERSGRVSLIMGLVYLPVALSHFILLPPAGRWPMFGVATATAVALLGAHAWVKRHPQRVDALWLLSGLLYACVIIHSLARMLYARGPAESVFVGVLAVGMALLPARLPIHTACVAAYLGGWSALMIHLEGLSTFRPYVAPLLLTFGVSLVARYLDVRSARNLLELQLLEGVRKKELVDKEQNDALTGLPNRTHFAACLAEAFDEARADDGQSPFAVLHLDIDRFKLVNESLGHKVGDQLLRAVAVRLLRFVRPGDTVARLGGDEFAVLLARLRASEDALMVAERMQTVLAEPFHLDDYEVKVDACIGIALYGPEYRSVGDMLRDADIAVGAAKKSPDRQRVFDGTMHAQALERLEVEVELRRALQRDELVVHYQPLVETRSRDLVGFEALVRWQHPERGLLGPGKFLGVAEESGLIVQLGQQVLERACRDLHQLQSAWRGKRPLHVSVNMAAKQFLHADAEPHLHRCLEDSGVPPEQLWIEITETTVLDQPKEAEKRIGRLSELGVKVCVDDFGIGYSSLGYLQRLSFSVLKLDRSFVKRGPRNEAIVAAVVTLARGLGMDVVAEGVESEEQLELVEQLGCPLSQGFLFERAVPLEEACALARRAHFRTMGDATSAQRGSKAAT